MSRRILVIQFKECKGILNGGALANLRCIEMAELFFGKGNVTPYYVTDGSLGNLFTHLKEALLFPFGYYRGLSQSKLKHIVQIAEDYDSVLICTSVYGLIAKALKQSGYTGRVLTHFHNVESLYYEAIIPRWLPFRRLLINCTYWNDKWSLLHADASMTLSQRDSDILYRYYGRRVDAVIPMSFDDKCKEMSFDTQVLTSQRPTCCFIGSNFPANSEGLLWFVQEVLPHVDVHFIVVGRDMDKLQQAQPCLANIEVHSSVPDLTPYYAKADFLIMPIFSGSGIKVKTCEALMYGRNILGTDEAFEGYAIDTDLVGALCNNAQEFIDAIQHYCQYPRPRYNSYARQLYLDNYTTEYSLSAFRSFLIGK